MDFTCTVTCLINTMQSVSTVLSLRVLCVEMYINRITEYVFFCGIWLSTSFFPWGIQCWGSLSAGWKRISIHRALQKGENLLRTKSRDSVDTASAVGWPPDRPGRVDGFPELTANFVSLQAQDRENSCWKAGIRRLVKGLIVCWVGLLANLKSGGLWGMIRGFGQWLQGAQTALEVTLVLGSPSAALGQGRAPWPGAGLQIRMSVTAVCCLFIALWGSICEGTTLYPASVWVKVFFPFWRSSASIQSCSLPITPLVSLTYLWRRWAPQPTFCHLGSAFIYLALGD